MRHFQRPSGLSEADDVTAALQAELDRGPGIVHLVAGRYVCAELRVPSNVTLAGEGAATVLLLPELSGTRPATWAIIRQDEATGFELRDLTLDGQAQGPWEQRDDAGESGVITHRCWGYSLSGLTIKRFRGAGLQLTRTRLAPDAAPFSNGGALDRIVAHDNFIGVRFDIRAEYLNATRLDCHHNVTGCVVHTGNVKLCNSNFCTNTDGVLIEDKENGSHGSISNCLINHNFRLALAARNAGNSMTIDNCCFFYGAIEIIDSAGIGVTSGLINCHIRTRGPRANRIAGNYIIPGEYEFDFAPATRVEGNYTDAGAWERNRPG
ncbi:MAG: hypothetical protein NTW19_15365 [Planctomycetota bacterium]|nr:hypothetical protein [Planctomycetota bacterium]